MPPETRKCELCGEPMPIGEEMFKYHGYSGNCPKPPLPKAEVFCDGLGDVHRWSDDFNSGDTCQCGRWYWIDEHGKREIRGD